jgi:hypothetical protein
MSRKLDLTEFAVDESHGERRLARSTARAFAAAVSVLLITTLVIDRSTAAVLGEGTVSASSIDAGTLRLFDDDGGQSLFELGAMVPGRAEERCLIVTYDGDVLPVDLALVTSSNGALGKFLDVSVDRGTGGSFDSCDGFVAEELIFGGTLAAFAEATADEPLPVGVIRNQTDAVSFKFQFQLQDNSDAMGLTSTVDFSWQVTPS